jgi:phosphoglycolate phosphatase
VTTSGGRPTVRAVIFDLDGTLVQTRVASWEIFSRINNRFGLGVDHPEQYFDLFRGNVFSSIRTLCRDDAHAAEVKTAFLELLRSDYTPPMIPGMVDVVRRLAGDCTLAVMSSNAMQVLRRVLVGNEVAFCFAHVFGGDVAPDKSVAIRAFLADSGSAFGRRCAADYDEGDRGADPSPAGTVLVTDTAGDVRDALAAGIRVVGVAWGMHSVDELTTAGAEFVALWPQELTAHLLGDAAAEPPTGACAVPARAEPAGRASSVSAASPGDCGCGCGDQAASGSAAAPAGEAGAVRRARRRAGALAVLDPPAGNATRLASAPDPGVGAGDELLDAIQRVCGDG